MPEFACKLATPSGRVTNQTEQADSEKELRERLLAQGYYVFSVRAKGGVGASLGGNRQTKVKADDFLIFNEQFLTLSKSGLPLQKSLELLARQSRVPKLRNVIEAVRDKVKGGALLSEAFESVGQFPKVYCATLRAGERSGTLDKVLGQYVSYQKAARTFRKKFLSALIYPSFLLVFLVILITFIISFVVPRFALLYKDLDVELPALTVYVISISLGFKRYALLILLALVGAILGLRMAFQSPRTRLLWDKIRFNAPVAGPLLLKFATAEFARTLSALLMGGVPITSALQTVRDSVSSPLLGQAIDQTRKEVTGGRTFSSSLKMTGVFPFIVTDMAEVGETTGALPNMLEALADFFEEDVSIELGTLVALVDPIMIAAIAIIVAFVLIAFYLPLFSLAGQVH
jgi:type IV pilus assembly protein PilC